MAIGHTVNSLSEACGRLPDAIAGKNNLPHGSDKQ